MPESDEMFCTHCWKYTKELVDVDRREYWGTPYVHHEGTGDCPTCRNGLIDRQPQCVTCAEFLEESEYNDKTLGGECPHCVAEALHDASLPA